MKKTVLIIFCLSLFYHNTFLFAQSPKYVSTIDTNKLDVQLFRSINNARSPVLDFVIPIIDRSVLPAAIITPPLMFFVARSNDNYYDENSAVLLGLSQTTSFIITAGLKFTFQRPRPYTALKNVYADPSSTLGDHNSFPSGHTSMTFAMATSLALRYHNPWLITGVFTYASIAAYGRMYLGVHYPTDVLTGMAVGSASALLMYSLRKEIFKAKNNLFGENKSDTKNNNINSSIVFGGIIAADLLNHFISRSSSKVVRSSSFSPSINGVSFQYSF